MGTMKTRSLTVENLRVTGQLVHDNAPEPGQAVPVAPHPLPLPEKITMAALRDRVEFLTWALIEAGIIHPVPRAEAETA